MEYLKEWNEQQKGIFEQYKNWSFEDINNEINAFFALGLNNELKEDLDVLHYILECLQEQYYNQEEEE
jgi:hypothetical protein